jgi:phospholipid/cholesterol/gamma-HCH transport system substrate-binding protein
MTVTPPRLRRRAQRHDTIPPRKVVFRALLSTGVVVGLVALALSIYGGAPWNSYKTIYVTVPDTGNLRAHDPVRIAGVLVGQVSGISVTQTGDARLALQINSGTKLPTGTTFALRANGLLGSRYVQLLPGHGSTELADNTTLRGGTDSLSYGVPEALNVFNQETRGKLGSMITGLGQGLLGRGTGLNQTIQQISAESKPAQLLVHSLIAANLQSLIPDLDTLSRPLDSARTVIGKLLAPTAKALQPFDSQRSALQNALTQAPSALQATIAGLGNGERLLDAADNLALQAQQVLPLAPDGFRQATALLADSNPALREARLLLVNLEPTVPAVLRVTHGLSPVLDPFSNALGLAIPIVDQLGPYGCNVENTAAVLRSMTGYGGTGSGPDGPAMAFRLEIVAAPPTEILGTKDYTGLVKRVGYAPPCTNLADTYPTSTSPLTGIGSGK